MIRLYRPTIWLIFALSYVCACQEDGGTNGGGEAVLGQPIAGTWAITDTSAVSVPEGDDKITEPGDLVGFRLTITPGTDDVEYITQTTISPVIFPIQGRLLVEEEDDFQAGAVITRLPDLVPMDMRVFESDSLLIEFSINFDSSIPSQNSRQAGITGGYRMILRKQQ